MTDLGDAVDGGAEREIDELVGASLEPSPAAAAKKARGRGRARGQTRAQDDQANDDVVVDPREVDELLQQGAPRTKERSLGDLYAKWQIPRPDFKVQVWRLMPKFYPNGTKADGFYDDYQGPLYETELMNEYGGGTLLVKIVGPHKDDPRSFQVYDSIQVTLGGEPNYERRPRAAKPPTSAMPTPSSVQAGGEDPKLATAALGHMAGAAQQERDERHRVEERAEKDILRARENIQPLVEAERRRADDVMEVERKRATEREAHLLERAEQERTRAETLLRRIEDMETSRPSMTSQFREAAEIFKPNGEMAERMFQQTLEKHKTELEAIRASHQREVETIRASHASEIAAIRSNHSAETNMLRESHQRDLENERAAGKRREERLEDQVKSERDERDRRVKMEQDERTRDRERHREQMDDKERANKERLQSAEEVQKQQAESKYSLAVNNYESRISRLEEDLSRLRGENIELRGKAAEVGDAVSIVKRGEEIKEALGIKPAESSGGGGIGLTPPADDWKNTFAEAVGEKIPEIVDKIPQILQLIFGGQQPQGQPPQVQQQYQIGQIIRTPEGREMVVVANPAAGPGALGMVPREAYERSRGRAPTRQLPPGAPAAQPGQPQPQPRKRKRREAVVNLADGLPPLPRPPWEDDDDEVGMVDQPPPSPQAPMERVIQRAVPPAPAAPPSAPVEAREITPQERMVLERLAKMVHDAVSHAEEPEELVAKMGEYPPQIVQQIAATPPEQIIAGIREVQPTSAGASPEGQQFILRAMAVLRLTLAAAPA